MKHEFLAKSTKGKLHIINRKGFDELLLSELDGKDLILTIEHKRAKRSDSQNKFYWVAIIPIMQAGFKDLGHRLTREQTHEFLKDKFLEGKPMASKEGVYMGHYDKTTATLNKSEFADYIAQIGQFAAEYLGIEKLPEPLEQQHIEYNN